MTVIKGAAIAAIAILGTGIVFGSIADIHSRNWKGLAFTLSFSALLVYIIIAAF